MNMQENILELIAKAARFDYNKIAIKSPVYSWSYCQLLSAACVVAEKINQKVPQNKFVLVEAKRCPEFIVAILGIMLSKRAFVPVSMEWPRVRVDVLKRKLKEDSDVLEIAHVKEMMKPIFVNRVTEFERLADCVSEMPHSPAYCICTSGSTGEPKCVEILHQGIPNLVENQRRVFDTHRNSCFLWMLSPVFDGSFSDIFVALASGSTIAIDPVIEMPAYAWRAAEDAEATHIDIPHAILEILSPSEMPKSVKCLIVGGQQLSKKIVERYAPKCKVVNVYGPTEATICTSAKVYDETNCDNCQISIGLPFKGVNYKIDSNGELLISGIQLARQYLGDMDLTRKKFFSDFQGKWYRTGDLVKRVQIANSSDPEYIFVGRIDRQFKVNGKLVAPEEIEAVASKYGIAAAVVEHLGKIKCLVEDLEPRMMNRMPDIKRIFTDALPEWMVPSIIKFVEKLPRLQVGKIDYASVLRAFDSDQPVKDLDEDDQADEQPTSILSEVKKMMASILNPNRPISVSSSASFKNDYGADSIQQIMLSLKIKSRWGVQLLASDFKLDDTPTGIAALLERKINRRDSVQASKLQEKVDELAKSIDNDILDFNKDTVIITGAAGFLGSQVLNMLLSRWSKIVCIVKAKDDNDAREKVVSALNSKVGMTLVKPKRIECYAGDLSVDKFGLLDPSTYDRLCKKTKLVYHIAGEVNDWKSGEDLAASNIEATKNVIKFCKRSQAKLVFASTLSVFVSRSDLPSCYSCYEDPLDGDGIVVGGYAQSKWIAEKLVFDTMGDNARIMRYGLLTEPTDRAMIFKQSTLSMFLRGLKKIHAVPEVKTNLKIDFTPVDIAAAITTRAFNTKHPILHVHAGMQVGFSEIAAKILPNSLLLDYRSWKKHAMRKLEESGYDKDIAVCIEALAREEGSKFGPFDLFQSTGMIFYRTYTFEVYDETLEKLESNAHHNYVDKLLRTSYAEADKDW